jgi:putative aminopeptidase FrvX
MKDTIKKLVEAWGPSGFEHHVRALIEAEIAGLADEVRTDAVGNLICRMGSGGSKIMVAAHMDEIGLILTYQDEKGFFRFNPLGGLMNDTLYGNRVRFENDAIGTIGREGGFHRSDVSDLNEFYVDVSDGAGGYAEVRVGDAAGFFRRYEERGNRIIAKSLDDRIGCAIAIEAMRRLAQGDGVPNEVHFVFTVQEEVGVRGARPAAFGLEPDLGVAVDITPCPDTPRSGMKMAIELGKGAAIKVYDRGLVVPPAVKNLMIERAEAAQIPYQLEVLTMGSTDASGISRAGAGVPSGCISIPTRYGHTVSETVDMADVLACVNLLTEVVGKPVAL